MSNIVAIVGRPNVGKSTLFNRLVESRDAIVDDLSGVTRDRHYGQAQWIGRDFTVIDTGGYVVGSEDEFEGAIRSQVEIALEEAAIILFVVDCHTGLTGLDEDFAKVIRRTQKPVLVVANKADHVTRMLDSNEFYELGMGEVYPVSSANGSGTGELLDAVVAVLPELEQPVDLDLPRIAIVGRPNVGKSSFVNMLLGQERSIVTDIAGTTRDAVDAVYNAFGKKFILTDTAGIRKKAKVKEDIEFYSVLRSIKAIEKADVCIVVVDATQGVEAQDYNIIQLALEQKKGVVLMLNKWDLVSKDSKTAEEMKKEMLARLAPNSFLPVIFTSVLEKQRVMKVIEKAIEVFDCRRQKIPTSLLNDTMLKEIDHYPPPAHRSHYIKIKYLTQLPTYTPVFAYFCNHPKHVKEAYKRFLENKMRAHFNLEGVPITIVFREK